MLLYAFVQKLDNWLASIERVLLIVLTMGVAGIMMTQVIMRYFLSSPIFWAEEIAVQLLVFLTLFGLSLLVHSGQLVTIDFLARALPAKAKHGLFALLGLIMLSLLVFIGMLGWDWIARLDVRIELGATTQLPRWYNYTALPVALAAMAFHQAAAVMRHLRLMTGAPA